MAMIMPFARQPFAELSSERLQQLTNFKNRQNGLFQTPTTNIKSPLSIMTKASPSPVSTNNKRARDSSPASSVYEDDGENVDPSLYLSPSKKIKGMGGTSNSSSFTFRQPGISNSLFYKTFASTPTATISASRTTRTSPAGRSQSRRKISPGRRGPASYTRIDPPSSSQFGSSGPLIPFFSFEDALGGSLPNSAPAVHGSVPKSRIVEAAPVIPKSWFFNIHEDTPEQEAEALMEHSTSILDLSSDEEIEKKAKYRGKENIAPPGYVAPAPSAAQGEKAKRQRRRKVLKKDEMDDGLRRPLGEVEREDFFGEGLTGDEVVIVDGEGVKADARSPKAAKVRAVASPAERDQMADVVVFED